MRALRSVSFETTMHTRSACSRRYTLLLLKSMLLMSRSAGLEPGAPRFPNLVQPCLKLRPRNLDRLLLCRSSPRDRL